MGSIRYLLSAICGQKCGRNRLIRLIRDNEKLKYSYYYYQYLADEEYYDEENSYYYSDDKLAVYEDEDNNDDDDDDDDDGREIEEAASSITILLFRADTIDANGRSKLQKTVDDILVLYHPNLKHLSKVNKKRIGIRSCRGTSDSSSSSSDINTQIRLTRKWTRAVARAVLRQFEGIVARELAVTNDDDDNGNNKLNDGDNNDPPCCPQCRQNNCVRMMGKAMRCAYERALEEAKVTVSSAALRDLPRDHPVWCALVALGVLVPLAPWVLDVLGFSELGPVAGIYKIESTLF